MHPLRWWRETFTGVRWNRNPFQMWTLLFLNSVSFNQIFFANVSGAVSELDRQSQVWLAICNLTGGLIVMLGLHLRELVMSQWIELCGYFALTGSMGIYLYVVLSVSIGPVTSFGVGLSQAFIAASLHRAIWLARHKYRAEVTTRKEVSNGDQDQGEAGERGEGR